MALYDFKRFRPVTPAIARGQDVTLELTGPVSAAGWTLVVYASATDKDGPADVSGLTASASTTTITVTIPAASVASVPVSESSPSLTGDAQPTTPLYVEVWRTDSGNTRPLGRYVIEVYDPVKEVA